jgi:phage terminase large subunit-like protein
MQYPLGQPHRTSDDYWCAFLLQLDKWELTDDLTKLDDPELFKKVNRSIGTTVQPTYYRERLHEAATGTEDTKQEVLTKDFNMWQAARVQKWIPGDKIAALQVERTVADCTFTDAWQTFVGLDFSLGDDLFAITYLGENTWPNQPADQRMFADTEAWIVEKALQDSPNRQLYEMWVQQGWLNVCPGEVFNPDAAINDLMAKHEQGLNLFAFGYDPAQSIQPINTIKAWLHSLFQEQGISQKEIPALIKRMVVPVPQNFVTMNGLIQKLEWLLLGQEYNVQTGRYSYTLDSPFLYLSNSPLWPWCFGNAKVEISSSELRAVRKSNQHAKIDPVHALLDAQYVSDLSKGQIQG